jgi:hypothetical protein
MQNTRSFGMRLLEAMLWVASFIVLVGFAYMIVGDFLPMAGQQQAEPCVADVPQQGKPKPC